MERCLGGNPRIDVAGSRRAGEIAALDVFGDLNRNTQRRSA
jgi:hypothetical protein